MHLLSATAFYRYPTDHTAHIEDGHFLNICAGFFGVVDGVSAAYSPKHPPLRYSKGLTGGQVAASIVCRVGSEARDTAIDLEQLVLQMNTRIWLEHKNMGKMPGLDDVGGTGFAFCKVAKDGLEFILGSDCAVFVIDDTGVRFVSGFDTAAQIVEFLEEKNFARHLMEQGGNKENAWDAHFTFCEKKRLKYINKQIGSGGFALLNGDHAVQNCWTNFRIAHSSHPRLVLLLTDGMLPLSWTASDQREKLTQKLLELSTEGTQALLDWRDSETMRVGGSPHINGWPEATMVQLVFAE